jgi:hypothetical protein
MFKRPGINMPMSPNLVDRYLSPSQTDRLKSFGDAIQVYQVCSGLWFESVSQPIQHS